MISHTKHTQPQWTSSTVLTVTNDLIPVGLSGPGGEAVQLISQLMYWGLEGWGERTLVFMALPQINPNSALSKHSHWPYKHFLESEVREKQAETQPCLCYQICTNTSTSMWTANIRHSTRFNTTIHVEVSWFIPKELPGEIRAVCRPVSFFGSKLGKPFLYGSHFCPLNWCNWCWPDQSVYESM